MKNGNNVARIFTFFKIFLIIAIIFFGQARRACQRQRSILLEFDTRGEVEDFQRLVGIFTFFQKLSGFVTTCSQVRDEHLGLKPDQLVWIGVSYQQVPKLLKILERFLLISYFSVAWMLKYR